MRTAVGMSGLLGDRLARTSHPNVNRGRTEAADLRTPDGSSLTKGRERFDRCTQIGEDCDFATQTHEIRGFRLRERSRHRSHSTAACAGPAVGGPGSGETIRELRARNLKT